MANTHDERIPSGAGFGEDFYLFATNEAKLEQPSFQRRHGTARADSHDYALGSGWQGAQTQVTGVESGVQTSRGGYCSCIHECHYR